MGNDTSCHGSELEEQMQGAEKETLAGHWQSRLDACKKDAEFKVAAAMEDASACQQELESRLKTAQEEFASRLKAVQEESERRYKSVLNDAQVRARKHEGELAARSATMAAREDARVVEDEGASGGEVAAAGVERKLQQLQKSLEKEAKLRKEMETSLQQSLQDTRRQLSNKEHDLQSIRNELRSGREGSGPGYQGPEDPFGGGFAQPSPKRRSGREGMGPGPGADQGGPGSPYREDLAQASPRRDTLRHMHHLEAELDAARAANQAARRSAARAATLVAATSSMDLLGEKSRHPPARSAKVEAILQEMNAMRSTSHPSTPLRPLSSPSPRALASVSIPAPRNLVSATSFYTPAATPTRGGRPPSPHSPAAPWGEAASAKATPVHSTLTFPISPRAQSSSHYDLRTSLEEDREASRAAIHNLVKNTRLTSSNASLRPDTTYRATSPLPPRSPRSPRTSVYSASTTLARMPAGNSMSPRGGRGANLGGSASSSTVTAIKARLEARSRLLKSLSPSPSPQGGRGGYGHGSGAGSSGVDALR
eukprot:gene31111-6243_t